MADIRRLLPQDAALFQALRLEALQTAPEAFGSTYAQECDKPLEWFAERLANSIILGAFSGYALIGIVALRPEIGDKTRHKALVWSVFITPAMAGKGIARQLLTRLLTELPPSIEQVQLSVVTTNHTAITLYRSLGFEIYGTEKHALKSAYGYCDEHLMTKFITARA